MNHGFWAQLNKPIMVMAPMANVTDAAFRQIITQCGKPDVFFTEFVSCDGLCSEGKERLLIDLKYTTEERPIVMQVFGSNPDNFYRTAELARELGFDGIDINTGCPDKSVCKQGAGASLMNDFGLTKEIVQATKQGAGDLPISIKTRLGYEKNIIEQWLPVLLETEPAAITIHARTKKEMSKVPARWDQLAKSVQIRNALGSTTLILGNGDVTDMNDAHEKVAATGVDGVMFGRAIFGDPWLFNKNVRKEHLTYAQILDTMVAHTRLFEQEFTGIKTFATMRKFFGSYVAGFPAAKQLKIELMKPTDATEVARVVEIYKKDVLGKRQHVTLAQDQVKSTWWESHKQQKQVSV
jgi:nifR3 family TIM-barrel protein